MTCFDDLGVYRILCEVEDPAAIERFVRQWLGALLDYDARKHSELVDTLCRYLECGGSYDEIGHAGHAPFFGDADAVAQALQPLLTSTHAMSLI